MKISVSLGDLAIRTPNSALASRVLARVSERAYAAA
jgi:hypothetical protein